MPKSVSRRSVLDFGWRSLAVAGLAPEILQNRAAAANTSTRAAVCIVMFGGNDSNNLVVPYDGPAYDMYARSRGVLAVPHKDLLAISSGRQNATFGFHPYMPEVQRLYGQGKIAVLANQGPLVQPIVKAHMANRQLVPHNLFQHTGGDHLKYVQPAAAFPPWAVQDQEADPLDAKPQVFQFRGLSVLFTNRLKNKGSRIDNPELQAAMNSAPALKGTVFPESSVGQQLRQVVQLLQASAERGWSKPVFSVSMSGFDTHRNQMPKQAALFGELSQALWAFHSATDELGISSDVSTFTYTEFNRTLAPNNEMGSEHAWGGHQLVMGGSVIGGDIYGRFPSLELGGPDDAGDTGILIPTVSSHQYHATLSRWFGASAVPEGVPTAPLGFLV
jgi:uncharacterized protein (DUF1501 family)